MFKRNSSIGMTLIECMLACGLMLIVLSVVVKIYLSAQKNFTVQKNILLTQYNANLIRNIFNENVHQAGFLGCARFDNQFPITNKSGIMLQQNNKISSCQSSNSVPGSDGFSVWYAENQNLILLRKMRGLSNIIINKKIEIHAGDVLIISDCLSADIFVVGKIQASQHALKITSAQPLSKIYSAGAEVYPLAVNHFFLTKTEEGINSLFLRDVHGVDVELAQQVNKMKMTYLIANQHSFIEKSADQLDSQDNIRGVAIDLQFTSAADASFHQDWYVYAALRQI